MRIMIEATNRVTTVRGTECRMWAGVTENGVECDVMVALLRVRSDVDCAEFEAELREMPAPSEAIDLRFVL